VVVLGGGTGTERYELSPGKKGNGRRRSLLLSGRQRWHRSYGGGARYSRNIYGYTEGGDYNKGTIFELVAPVGRNYQEKVLLEFQRTGGFPFYGGLILDSFRQSVWHTYRGGSNEGVCGGMAGCGVAFEITP